MLIKDHPGGQNKIQDDYKFKLFVNVAHHKDPNVYIIQSINKKGPIRTVNRWQLFDLKKSQDDPSSADPSIKGPKYEPKLKEIVKPQICHPYGTRSKTMAAAVSTKSVELNIQSGPVGHLGLGQWVSNLVCNIKDATVAAQQTSSAKRWSAEILFSSYLARGH